MENLAHQPPAQEANLRLVSNETLPQPVLGEAIHQASQSMAAAEAAEAQTLFDSITKDDPAAKEAHQAAQGNLEAAASQYQTLLEDNPSVVPGLFLQGLKPKINHLQKIYRSYGVDEWKKMIEDPSSRELELGILQDVTRRLPDGEAIENEAFRLAVGGPNSDIEDSPMAELFSTENLEASLDAPLEQPIEPEEAEVPTPEDKLDSEIKELDDSLEAMRYEFMSLARSLKDPIEKQAWTSIIGDDVSGRLPTLFVHHLTQRYGQMTGAEVPPVVFAAPSNLAGKDLETNLKTYFENQEDKIGDSPLIVTEFIATGDTIRILESALPEATYGNTSIATLAISPHTLSTEFGSDGGRLGANELYYGEQGPLPAMYESAREAAGTKKNSVDPTSHRRDDYNGRLVKHAREQIKKMADEAFDEVFAPAELPMAA